MTQAQIAKLYGRDVSSISRHIANIIEEVELDEAISLQKVQKSLGRPLILYNLDMVISVGYRVASRQATLFRKWATDKFARFATKGFVIDAPRLKSPAYRDRIAGGCTVAMKDAKQVAGQEYQKFNEERKKLRHADADAVIKALKATQKELGRKN